MFVFQLASKEPEAKKDSSPPDLFGFDESLYRDLERVNRSKLTDLPSSTQYAGCRTVAVYQGQARFLDPKGSVDGFYTASAMTCSVLVAVSRKRFTGEVTNVGMAHIDASTSESSINDFYDRLLSGRNDEIEIYVISGHEQPTALRVLKVARARGANVRFFNADLDGKRDDAVVVDKKGRVYYGERDDFYSLDVKLFKAMQRRLSEKSRMFTRTRRHVDLDFDPPEFREIKGRMFGWNCSELKRLKVPNRDRASLEGLVRAIDQELKERVDPKKGVSNPVPIIATVRNAMYHHDASEEQRSFVTNSHERAKVYADLINKWNASRKSRGDPQIRTRVDGKRVIISMED